MIGRGLLLAALVALASPAGAQTAPPQVDADRAEAGAAEAGTAQAGAAQAGAAGASVEANVPGILRVALEPREVTIGGRVRATLTLVWMGEPLDAPPRFPAFNDGWGDAEVLVSSEVERFTDEVGRIIYRQELELAAFHTGSVELPAASVAVPLAERTVDITAQTTDDAALTFEVVSVLPEAAAEAEPGATDPTAPGTPPAAEVAPKPPAPPVQLDGDSRFAWTAGILLGLLALSLWRLLVALERAPAVGADGEPVDPLSLLPPLEELRQRLAQVDPVRPEPAHTALSLALRTYLDRRLQTHAVEATTTEIQRRLRSGPVDPDTARRAVELLRACDRAKFARESVEVSTTTRRVEETESIAGAIDRVLHAVENAEPGGPGAHGPGALGPGASGANGQGPGMARHEVAA